jgi:hypothetical protein
MGKFTPHAILQRKRQERKCGRREENAHDRDHGEELEKLQKHRES